MLAPRIQTSDFCWLNIELVERGALFLSNYMKLQQLSHSFWQSCLGGDKWCSEFGN
jgi:hypothetical protein